MRFARFVRIVTVAAVVMAPAAPALAGHDVETGYVHTGVGSEEEARAYPCARTDAGGWERTGPVVCFDKKADVWTLDYENTDGCTWHHINGYSGTCVSDVDMDDHVRVWGNRGIPYTKFTLSWGHGDSTADDADSDGGGSDGGGPGSPSSPGSPDFDFDQPGGPGTPDFDFDAPDGPESPDGPDGPDAPDRDVPVASDADTGDTDSTGQDANTALAASEDTESAGSTNAVAIAAGIIGVLAAVGGGAWFALRRRPAP